MQSLRLLSYHFLLRWPYLGRYGVLSSAEFVWQEYGIWICNVLSLTTFKTFWVEYHYNFSCLNPSLPLFQQRPAACDRPCCWCWRRRRWRSGRARPTASSTSRAPATRRPSASSCWWPSRSRGSSLARISRESVGRKVSTYWLSYIIISLASFV